MNNLFASKKAILAVGVMIGCLAALLQKLGNPANMGICVACFERDIAGALGFHRAAVVQYLRPEILGLVFGSFIAALLFREFKPRSGSAPMVRFLLGFFAMIGALVFLGCPWRVLLRLAGGDGNALAGLAGLVTGIWIGVLFIKSGYNLGRSQSTYRMSGLILPIMMGGLLLILFINPQLAPGPLFSSVQGPGSMHAPVAISLLIGLVIGFLAQRTRFCTMGAIRDFILIRDLHLMTGVAGLFAGALITNLVFGQFQPGLTNQPVAHKNIIWNFGGMVLAGLAFAMAGGCPGRQLFLSGEGDGDAAIFVLGMLTGAAFAHNFAAASSPSGPGQLGPLFVIIGLVTCIIFGLTMRRNI